ncbi:hypothetical protein BDQ12DRAFT_377424 [Crucibulum laeve]|uniref:Uncharacterized protein n=1 Tax=Crucibulum laeve TaxID=68775 RepID=A0A5C3LQG2_9AGAR|nr:hypothetical protein BDQ12DRAFT_377424 [Crucibulum laeve]
MQHICVTDDKVSRFCLYMQCIVTQHLGTFNVFLVATWMRFDPRQRSNVSCSHPNASTISHELMFLQTKQRNNCTKSKDA